MTRRIVLVGVLVLAVGSAAAGLWLWTRSGPAPTIPTIALDGVEEGTAMRVREALQQVSAQPRSGKAWGKLGMVLQANGFHEHVGTCYTQAERLDPESVQWPYLHGILMLEIDPREAVPLFLRALERVRRLGDRAAILFRLAQVLIELGRYDEAAERLADLRALEPEGARVRFGEALLAHARGRHEEARELFRSLLDDPHGGRQSMLLLAGLVDANESAALLKRFQRTPPPAPWPDPIVEEMRAHYVDRMARMKPFFALQSQGRQEEALEYLRRLAAEAPDREVLYHLGFELTRVGQYVEAEAALLEAIRLEPTNVKSHVVLAECRLQRGEALAGRGAGSDPGAAELFAGAVEAAKAALRLHPEYSLAHLLLGRALHRLGQRQEALAALRRVVVIQPEFSDGHLYLGELLCEIGQLQEGLKHIQLATDTAKLGDERARRSLQFWRGKQASVPER